MAEETDNFLLEKLAQGDPELWKEIVRRYTGRLLAFAEKQVGRHRSEAEDLVQEVFLILALQKERIRDIRSLEGFLFQILRRRIVDFRRKKKAETLTDSRWKSIALTSQRTPSSIITFEEEQHLGRKTLAEALQSYLKKLKKRSLRELSALELLLVAGKSGNEVASRFNLTPVQVSRIKHGCIRFLRSKLREKSFQHETISDLSISEVWLDNMLTCIKRSVLGAYQVGILDPETSQYVKLHLEETSCPYCNANLEDIKKESLSVKKLQERILATSSPFLSKGTKLEGGGQN